MAGRKPGTPKTGGRKKGVPNKATADVKALAQKYAPSALQELARLSGEAESEQARVSGCREILDRAYGKAPQAIDGSVQLGVSEELQMLLRAHDGKSRGLPKGA